MRFDNVSSAEEVVWQMRIADLPRSEDRKTILRLYNGNPPFDEATAEDNNIQVNRNDLTGTNVLSRARSQWNNAHLKPANFFWARPDSGPIHKRTDWGLKFTKNANRALKSDRRMTALIRGQGANTLLYGIGPSNWKDRRSIIPQTVPVGSVMIPSETEIDDFDNVSYFAIFREWTPAQLWDMTHGPKVDPGWNMPLVNAQWDYLKDELRKSPNSLAYQYMPERIEELMKQDKGYMGSDAVPTCDVWDMYFRDEDAGCWYRRIFLDWNTGGDVSAFKESGKMPDSRNKVSDTSGFLYTSGKRKYADSLSQIIHFQFGDCSPYAPFKYHSIRGLGWMLWGVCELQNRLFCKFNEALFEQLMWFFQTAGNQDLIRLKKANFEHMGVIPAGIKFLTPQERYIPNAQLMELGFAHNQRLISESSTAFTQGYDKGADREARTATETMAIVNSSQGLTSSILELSYTYQKYLYMEMVRRLCLKNSTDPMTRKFRKDCLADGIPSEMLDAERWQIEPEQVLGGGNKTMQMGIVQYLNSVRQNFPPAGQRLIDHMGVATVTDQADLAEEISPISDDRPLSNSMHDAQLATQRLLRGLPYQPPKDAIFEDYVRVWLFDLSSEIQRIYAKGGVPTPDELSGLMNLGQTVGSFIGEMAKNEDERPKVKEYEDAFGKLMNHLKGFEQRLQQAVKQQPQPNGADPKDAAKVQAMLIQAQTKAAIAENSAASRTRQKEEQFQLAERRKDQELVADIARTGIETRHELMGDRMRTLQEVADAQEKADAQPKKEP